MDWMELLYKVFELCVIPLLGVVSVYLVQLIKAKSAEFTAKSDNELLDKYITMAANTISDCVMATNQTYVESLKAQGQFDSEAQKRAFQITYESVIKILSDDAKDYLTGAYGDLSAFLTTKIEAEVKLNK